MSDKTPPAPNAPESAGARLRGLARALAGNELFSLLATRLAMALPLLLGVSLLTFTVLHFTAGDKVIARLGDRANSPAEVAKIREELGLNDPFLVQYGRYIERVAFHLDLGRSWTGAGSEKVSEALARRFPATLELALASMLIAVFIGLIAGVAAARWRNTVVDYASMSTALMGLSIPVFWLGLILVYVFSVKLQWLPLSHRLPSGMADTFEPITGMNTVDAILLLRWDVLGAALQHLLLPALTVGTISAALIARMTRASMLESAGQDFARTARAKGLSDAKVTWHIFRNAAIPIVTVIGLQLGALLGGAIITETIFTWEGLGKYLVDSILSRDGEAVQGAVLLITATFVLVNALVDVAYLLLDPRVTHRSQKAGG